MPQEGPMLIETLYVGYAGLNYSVLNPTVWGYRIDPELGHLPCALLFIEVLFMQTLSHRFSKLGGDIVFGNGVEVRAFASRGPQGPSLDRDDETSRAEDDSVAKNSHLNASATGQNSRPAQVCTDMSSRWAITPHRVMAEGTECFQTVRWKLEDGAETDSNVFRSPRYLVIEIDLPQNDPLSPIPVKATAKGRLRPRPGHMLSRLRGLTGERSTTASIEPVFPPKPVIIDDARRESLTELAGRSNDSYRTTRISGRRQSIALVSAERS